MRNSLIGAAFCLGAATLAAAPAAAAEPGAPLITVSRYVLIGESPLSAADTEALLAPLAGPKFGIGDLEADARRIEEGLRQRGYAFQRVILPPQKPVDGVVELKLLRFNMGQIRVSGNQYFSRENILASLPQIRTGTAPDPVETARELAIANANPSKQVQVLIRATSSDDTIEADLKTTDRPPFSGYVQLANSGSAETGRERMTLGFQHANLFDRDHVLGFSYTTSPTHSGDVQQYGANYSLPLYDLGASLSFYYVKSDVNSGQVAGIFDVSGSGTFWGATFNYALPGWSGVIPSLSVSLEDRYFDNDVKFSGTSLFGPVRSRPLSLRLQARQENSWGAVSAYAESARNIGGGGSNDDEAYLASGNGTVSAHWSVWRFGADLGVRLPADWRLLGRFRAQSSTHNLISGEQFGVGGAWSVRGFQERALAGDSGYLISVEALSPGLIEGLRAAAFADMGGVVNRQASGAAGKPAQKTVSSVGVGLRYQGAGRLEARADLARVVRGVDDLQAAGSWRGHASLIYRF